MALGRHRTDGRRRRRLVDGAVARDGLLLADVHPGSALHLLHAGVRGRRRACRDRRRHGLVRPGRRRRGARRGHQGDGGHRAARGARRECHRRPIARNRDVAEPDGRPAPSTGRARERGVGGRCGRPLLFLVPHGARRPPRAVPRRRHVSRSRRQPGRPCASLELLPAAARLYLVAGRDVERRTGAGACRDRWGDGVAPDDPCHRRPGVLGAVSHDRRARLRRRVLGDPVQDPVERAAFPRHRHRPGRRRIHVADPARRPRDSCASRWW